MDLKLETLKQVVKAVNDIPNDMTLGEYVRNLIRSEDKQFKE